MSNSTVTHLPSSLAAGAQGATLCLSVLDSASIPVPLQPEEAQKLCSLESLMILRESRSSTAGPSTAKIVFSDIVLGDASMRDVVNCITNDLGTEFDSLVPLISQDDPANRIASLRQFLMKQMGLLIASPDVQVFGCPLWDRILLRLLRWGEIQVLPEIVGSPQRSCSWWHQV